MGIDVFKDEDEAELTQNIHVLQIELCLWGNLCAKEAKASQIRISRREDIQFHHFDQVHIHNSMPVVGHHAVEERGVVQWALCHSRPAGLCVHVK